MNYRQIWSISILVMAMTFMAHGNSNEYLVKFSSLNSTDRSTFIEANGGNLELVSVDGNLYKWTAPTAIEWKAMNSLPEVEFLHPNYKVSLPENPALANMDREKLYEAVAKLEEQGFNGLAYDDNPAIKSPPSQSAGKDPMISKTWGVNDIKADTLWQKSGQGKGIVVAVTDTGIDYNHEDLIANMWRNPNEIAGNGKDDDENGFIDDIVGWDFFSKDNKPYDLTHDLFGIILFGGNAGHGTHCAGVVGARGNNSKGIAGVAPLVSLMAVRILGDKGQGDLASIVGGVDYAINNGAHIISASWGLLASPDDEEVQALKEALNRVEEKGVLFVAAAGNGKLNQATMTVEGFDNDTDPEPALPASLPNENIVAVAAIDSENTLASFSNWGKRTVDVGAPGVKVFSTVPGSRYQDTVIDLGELLHATWDGTSMATPHVSGAIAAIWSLDRNRSWKEIKELVLENAKGISALSGKVASDGKLHLSGVSR